VIIFHENLSIQNIIGILIVLIGVWTVQKYE
jgi:multidrug transporter EmrE-like cation transporter